MKLSQFIQEAVRVENPKKTEDTPERKKRRAPGDVGPVDRLTQMDKDKSEMTPRPRLVGPKNTIRMAKRNYKQAGQYVDRVSREAGETPEKPSNPSKESNQEAGGKEQESKTPKGRDEVSVKQDGKRIRATYRPRLDRVSASDKKMQGIVQDAEAPTVADPIAVPGTDQEVGGSAYLRHGYQYSGVGMPKELDKEALKYIYDASADENPTKKKKDGSFGADETGTIDMRGLETLNQFRPSARDLEALNPEAEKAAKDKKAYLDPKTLKAQKKMRDALDKADAKEVQKLAFQHEVSDEMIDEYIGMYGKSSTGKAGRDSLMRRIEGAGGTAPKEAIYGGDLGDEAEEYKVQDGIYNMTKMKALNPKLFKALSKTQTDNRAREIIRTYLKQGGRNAYSQHEGIRAITDMDLEHIASLKGKDGGVDHPSNWAMVGYELNRLKGEKRLTGDEGVVDRYAEGEKVLDTSQMGPTFSSFTQGDPELEQQVIDTLGGIPGASGKKGGVFAKGVYKNMDPEEREMLRYKAKDLGMRDADVEKMIPDEKPDPSKVGSLELPVGDGSNSERFGKETYLNDPEQFDKDVIVDARDRAMKYDMIDSLQQLPKYKGLKSGEIQDTPEYKTFVKRLRDDKGALGRDTTEPTPTMDDSDF